MWAGEVDLADKQTKLLYGRAHWEKLVQNLRDGRLQEAIRNVSQRRENA